jgi:hypothetical protein
MRTCRKALDLLEKLGCDVGPNYDYGTAVDLKGDGNPEYQMCCHEFPHGPCYAVLIDVCLANVCSTQPTATRPCTPMILRFDQDHYREFTPPK